MFGLRQSWDYPYNPFPLWLEFIGKIILVILAAGVCFFFLLLAGLNK